MTNSRGASAAAATCYMTMKLRSQPTRTSLILPLTSKRQRGVTDSELIDRMVLRAAHCRELAAYLVEGGATKTLRQMADEIEADIKRLRAGKAEDDSAEGRPAIPLTSK